MTEPIQYAPAEQIALLEAQLALLKSIPTKAPEPEVAGLKLDLGCGGNKRDGFLGVDQYPMKDVDVVLDLRKPWPWPDASVDEAHTAHFIEHLSAQERIHFFNELWRVLKPGKQARVIAPNWASARAYGDPTHLWPPIGPFFFLYLDADWRKTQAPHVDSEWNPDGYKCSFGHTLGYNVRQDLMLRNPEYTQAALQTQIEAGQDIVATLVRK